MQNKRSLKLLKYICILWLTKFNPKFLNWFRPFDFSKKKFNRNEQNYKYSFLFIILFNLDGDFVEIIENRFSILCWYLQIAGVRHPRLKCVSYRRNRILTPVKYAKKMRQYRNSYISTVGSVVYNIFCCFAMKGKRLEPSIIKLVSGEYIN